MRLRPRAAASRLTLAQTEPGTLPGVLLRGLRDALRGAPMKAPVRRRLLSMDLIRTVPGRYSTLTDRGLLALRLASGIAARSDETPLAAQSVGQEPGPSGDARKESPHSKREDQ